MKALTTNWNLMRVLGLIIGLFLLYKGVEKMHWLFIGIGAVMVIWTLFNINLLPKKEPMDMEKLNDILDTEEVIYEEIE